MTVTIYTDIQPGTAEYDYQYEIIPDDASTSAFRIYGIERLSSEILMVTDYTINAYTYFVGPDIYSSIVVFLRVYNPTNAVISNPMFRISYGYIK